MSSIPPPVFDPDYAYEQQRRKVRSLQNWVIVMAVLIVFLGIAAPTTVIIYFNESAQTEQAAADRRQLEISCNSARANQSQLEALGKFARQLGVPITWMVPEVPAECEGVNGS